MIKNRFPFEVSIEEMERDVEGFVDAVFTSLRSSFLFLPRGSGFVDYPNFQDAYEVLKRHTLGFSVMEPNIVMQALEEDGLVFVVIRSMIGVSPPELAYLATERTNCPVSQGFVRSLDRRVRTQSGGMHNPSPTSQERMIALVSAACELLREGADEAFPDMVHRLDKVDTRRGLESVRHVASEGVPYAMVLYERFLGRPFASHRDSVSELVGAVMEEAVETKLRKAGITYRKTIRAERVEGFDQAPDFIVPDEWNPRIVVEAKITEDDGTARDKVTRIQHLAAISEQRRLKGQKPFQVVACIDGRGFSVRREDMHKLLQATGGKVFTLSSVDALIDHTELRRFRNR